MKKLFVIAIVVLALAVSVVPALAQGNVGFYVFRDGGTYDTTASFPRCSGTTLVEFFDLSGTIKWKHYDKVREDNDGADRYYHHFDEVFTSGAYSSEYAENSIGNSYDPHPNITHDNFDTSWSDASGVYATQSFTVNDAYNQNGDQTAHTTDNTGIVCLRSTQ